MEKPNYDIYVEEENCLYKETPEDDIIELVKENREKYIEKVKEHIKFLKKSKENESFLWLYEKELEEVKNKI